MAFNLSTTAIPYYGTLGEVQVALLASSQTTLVTTSLVTAVLVVSTLVLLLAYKSPYPYVNYDKWSWSYAEAKQKYTSSAKQLLAQGFEKFGGPFWMVTDYGPKLMLGPEYIEAVNHEPKLSLIAWSQKELMSHLPGFEVFGGVGIDGLIEDVVRIKLTQNLPKFTEGLTQAMTELLNSSWGNSPEWKTTHLRTDALTWVARLSALVFVSDELATNDEWLTISKNFTVDLFDANREVKKWPGPLRWVACYALPQCRRLQKEYARARALIRPVAQRRFKEVNDAIAAGKTPPKHNDAIEWLMEVARGRPFNPEIAQLSLTMASIHTTTDLLTQCLYHLCEHNEIIEPLRKEIVEVIGDNGWNKVSLYKLELLDSFMKESQRHKPVGVMTMNRGAVADVELPGGVKIRKGQLLGVSSHLMWDPNEFPEPEVFDPYRFVKRRQEPGHANTSHFVSTAPNFTAFSHGKHACPGRFFAANEVKIALSHILLKYDIRMKPGSAPVFAYGAALMSNPMASIEFRRRKEEISL